MNYDTPVLRTVEPILTRFIRVYPDRATPAGMGLRLELLGCEFKGRSTYSILFSFLFLCRSLIHLHNNLLSMWKANKSLEKYNGLSYCVVLHHGGINTEAAWPNVSEFTRQGRKRSPRVWAVFRISAVVPHTEHQRISFS